MSFTLFNKRKPPLRSPALGWLFAMCVGMLSHSAQAAWVINNVAGNGGVGLSDNSNAANAMLNKPSGLALDSKGNLYFVDTMNNRIRKVELRPVYSTTACYNTVTTSCVPSGVTVGAITTVIGDNAKLKSPLGLAIDAQDNIYVADTDNNRVLKFSNAGVMSVVSDQVKLPAALAVTPTGSIYIADTGNNRILSNASGAMSPLVLKDALGTPSTSSVKDAFGNPSTSVLNSPQGITVDASGNIFVADTNNNVIRKIDSTGKTSIVAGNGAEGSASENVPAASAPLRHPVGVAVDAQGNLYIADTDNNRIRKVDTSGKVSTVAGTGSEGDAGDNDNANAATLKKPRNIVVDNKGNLYVTDTNNNRIRRIVFADYSLAASKGINQTIRVGETSQDIVFTVKDAMGNPSSGKVINFTVGDVYGNSSTVAGVQASLSPTSAITNAQGEVVTRLSSTASSVYKVTAKLADSEAVASTLILTGSSATGGGSDSGGNIVNITITTGSISNNVSIGGTVVNNGTVANATVQPNATLQGGIIAGVIINYGILINFEFTGTSLTGGTLSGLINNTNGGTLQDIILTANSQVKGGKVKGKVKGDTAKPALLENVEITENTELSNVILGNNVTLPKTKNVTLINVTFTQNISIITNVKLQGTITGNAQAPAVLDEGVEVAEESTLINVVITQKVILPKKVTYGRGVRFSSLNQIAKTLDLANLLPFLSIPSDCGNKCTNLPSTTKRIDLNASVLQTGSSILAGLNSLVSFKQNAWTLIQHKAFSYIHVMIGTIRFAVQPVTVNVDTAAANSDVQVVDPTTVTLTTPDGVTVTGQPTPQDPASLQVGLTKAGVPNVSVQVKGNLRISVNVNSEDWFSAHPDIATQEVTTTTVKDEYGNPKTTGVYFTSSTHVQGITVAYHLFTDDDGKLRRQFYYPAPAQPEIVVSLVKELGIEMDNAWQMRFLVDGKKYRGALDYHITKGTPSSSGKLEVKYLKNQGNHITYILTYPDGSQQQLLSQPD
jgi:sugar lactone lactonase YvrE